MKYASSAAPAPPSWLKSWLLLSCYCCSQCAHLANGSPVPHEAVHHSSASPPSVWQSVKNNLQEVVPVMGEGMLAAGAAVTAQDVLSHIPGIPLVYKVMGGAGLATAVFMESDKAVDYLSHKWKEYRATHNAAVVNGLANPSTAAVAPAKEGNSTTVLGSNLASSMLPVSPTGCCPGCSATNALCASMPVDKKEDIETHESSAQPATDKGDKVENAPTPPSSGTSNLVEGKGNAAQAAQASPGENDAKVLGSSSGIQQKEGITPSQDDASKQQHKAKREVDSARRRTSIRNRMFGDEGIDFLFSSWATGGGGHVHGAGCAGGACGASRAVPRAHVHGPGCAGGTCGASRAVPHEHVHGPGCAGGSCGSGGTVASTSDAHVQGASCAGGTCSGAQGGLDAAVKSSVRSAQVATEASAALPKRFPIILK